MAIAMEKWLDMTNLKTMVSYTVYLIYIYLVTYSGNCTDSRVMV